MDAHAPKPSIANPFSTGGGGITFEQRVATTYLVDLFCQSMPRGLDPGLVQCVRLQTRWAGCPIDDTEVISNDGYHKRRLAIQAKHDLSFAASDKTFQQVLSDCWTTFTGAAGYAFDKQFDRIGIAIGIQQTAIDKHLKPLLDAAKTSQTSAEFHIKLALPGYYSKHKLAYLKTFTEVLSLHNKAEVSQEDAWSFLRCLVVMDYQLEAEGSRDYAFCLTRLLDHLPQKDPHRAQSLFNDLAAIVAHFSQSAGSIDMSVLKAKLSPDLFETLQVTATEISLIRSNSTSILAAIPDSIGGTIRLPRSEVLAKLLASVTQSDVTIVSGQPMLGKSVLLKLLAQRLADTCDVVAFDVDLLSGPTIQSYLNAIGIVTHLPSLLLGLATKPWGCVLVDGIEKASDPDSRRAVAQLIRQVLAATTTGGSDVTYRWKIVLTCRTHEASSILSDPDFREAFRDASVNLMDVPQLNDEEISHVASRLPQLCSLVQQGHLRDILRRPRILDILTLPDIKMEPHSIPSVLTETWLIQWFWTVVVRQSECHRSRRGTPDLREYALLRVAEQLLTGQLALASQLGVDPEACAGLVSDRILDSDHGRLRFAHDAFQDWTLERLLQRESSDLAGFVTRSGSQPKLTRPLRLYSCDLLEVKRSSRQWVELLTALGSPQLSSTDWFRAAVGAPLSSPLLKDILDLVRHDLLVSDGILLSRLLEEMRRSAVSESPTGQELADGLPEGSLKWYAASTTRPDDPIWESVISFVLGITEGLSNSCIASFSGVCEQWMTNTSGSGHLREAVATFSLSLLEGDPSKLRTAEIRAAYTKAVLWGADCIPDRVKELVAAWSTHGPGALSDESADLILREGWIPLAKHLPDECSDLMGTILCEDFESRRKHSWRLRSHDMGIKRVSWDPPTAEKGPFRALLRMHPRQGLRLVNRIANHATRCWIFRATDEGDITPLPQLIRFGDKEVTVWGDETVYAWFRTPGGVPDALVCALMALEDWLNDQLQAIGDPAPLIEAVLKSAGSVSVVGVCITTILRNPFRSASAILPVMEQSAFWKMDIDRMGSDLLAETHLTFLSSLAMSDPQQAEYRGLVKRSQEYHRRADIRSLVPLVLFSDDAEMADRLQRAILGFEQSPFVLFKEEMDDAALMADRASTCKIWTYFGDRKNYECIKIGLEGIAYQFKAPPALVEIRRPEKASFDEMGMLLGFWTWACSFLENGVLGAQYTLPEALEMAKKLGVCDFSAPKSDTPFEPSGIASDASVIFASGAIVHRFEWVRGTGCADWFIQTVLGALSGRRLSSHASRPTSGLPGNARAAAAQALPLLFQRIPARRAIRNAIEALAEAGEDEVRTRLFRGLRELWDMDEKLLWRCVRRSIVRSAEIADDHRCDRMRSSPRMVIHWGKWAFLKRACVRFSSAFKKRWHLLRPPSLSTCAVDDLDWTYLTPALLCIPPELQMSEVSYGTRLIDFLHDCLLFTINGYHHFQKDRSDLNEWHYTEWTGCVLVLVAKAVLVLPESVAREKLVRHLMSEWEHAPLMLEKFLFELARAGACPKHEKRLMSIWLEVGNCVIDSELCLEENSRWRGQIVDLLRTLMLDNEKFVWNVKDWPALRSLTPFLERWCQTVGNRPDCFPSLLRMLSSAGFGLVPEFGVVWLTSCLEDENNRNAILAQRRCESDLAQLLYKVWSESGDAIRLERERYARFVRLVGLVAAHGDALALRLQKMLR